MVGGWFGSSGNSCKTQGEIDKPAADGQSGGYASEEDKAISANFAIANSGSGNAEA